METRLIRRILNPAVRLWLRSQVEEAKEIQFQLEGNDRHLLTGQIAPVFVSGKGIVYQGLHLSEVKLKAETIQINLGQVMRGKPIRLLEPIRAWGELQLQEADLNASIASPLLGSVLGELLDQWAAPLQSLGILASSSEASSHWQRIEIHFQDQRLILQTQLGVLDRNDPALAAWVPLVLHAQVTLANPQTIVLQDLEWTCDRGDIQNALATTPHLTIALGSDAAIQTLTLEPGQVTCEMHIMIHP